MKRIGALIFGIIITLLIAVPVFGDTKVSVNLNGELIEFNDSTGYPFVDKNYRTLVPLRHTMESAGFTVTWNETSKVASVADGKGTKVDIKIGDNYITKETNDNGILETSRIKNDTFARMVNNRTYLPIRIVLESFGSSVGWDEINNSVIVNTNGNSITISNTNSLNAEQIYDKYSPAVFYIEIYDSNSNAIGSGSGFFIDSKGIALTNFHVIEDAYSAKIKTQDGKTYTIEGVYDFNKTLDIAKIKINGSGFPYLPIGDSSKVIAGSETFAIGSPLGLDNTISQGIVSNANRVLDGISYIQTTAPISQVSSGGALFDKNGKVIGITSGYFLEGQNLNIAIPINNTKQLKNTALKKLKDLPKSAKDTTSFDAKIVSSDSYFLNADKELTVLISYINYNEYVDIEYVIEDISIVSAYWGKWYENTIPLTFFGEKPGTTDIKINLYDSETENLLVSKTVQVKCIKDFSDLYYPEYYPVPDLGTIFPAPIIDKYYGDNATNYYYLTNDLIKANSNFAELYSNDLLSSGFYYSGKFYDDAGDLVMTYKNNFYGLIVFISQYKLEGDSYYAVMLYRE
ncbi:trypsin-like peptidase domain-containing protein [Anaerovorax sp. IOR16]|uniref:trypsin-like peptidase domain-containing protein n=1 Tax=Anaerovorax sp. IOR16 TaxID=2773458 RepID=UPI0019D18BD1|nr:trypsin-like peptidase domain-containing protein [Anaerovorax sp. IOR16]